jgi:NAD(P)H-hydrate epimerase
MIPVVTPDEMRAVDAAALEPVDVLVDRAGRAVARAAVRMLGGVYGRRVVVVAGPGNNGADGRVAATVLERRGVRVQVVSPDELDVLVGIDLVIDAAYGTGLSRPYEFPEVAPGVPVLAVDIPSGVDGLTGESLGRPRRADETVTFVALKPGLLHEPGRSLCGRVRVVSIAGLEVEEVSTHVVERSDAAAWVPGRGADHHKWKTALRIVGGSAAMTGAVELAASAASRIAGYVEVAVPGREGVARPMEAVGRWLPATAWGSTAAADLDRFGAVLAGPGLRDPGELVPLLGCARPLLLDASALVPELAEAIRARSHPTIITPHDGEFARLGGSATADRISATCDLAADLGVVVLRKGPTTTIASPQGAVRMVTNGGPELASAGTGDVLAGLVAGLMASGADAFDAAAAGAWIHAAAASGRTGMVASDLPAAVPAVLEWLRG